jgi:hypothetical protein
MKKRLLLTLVWLSVCAAGFADENGAVSPARNAQSDEREQIEEEQTEEERRQFAEWEARIAAREQARREYWSTRFYSLGAAVGTAFVTPALLVSARFTFSPFRYFFFYAGADVGLLHGDSEIHGIEYLAIAPYLHYNLLALGHYVGAYLGGGGGVSFSTYTYPSESRADPMSTS